ncbi:MAG: hypothetical protein M1839_000714 [Geoglossum umbratile]|nr:MAG: hypothetical protein M1839_000714 [Geoglossum umbratile]
MALPVVHALADCADFSKTVGPFVPQLRSFSQLLLQAWAEPQRAKDLYLLTNPLISAFAFSLFLAPVILLVSEVNKNYSQVDRMWSILPTVYNAHYALWARLRGVPTQRLDTLLVFSALWTVGYFQAKCRVLLFLITAPTYVLFLASKRAGGDSTLVDMIFSRVLTGLVLFEWFADQQQWRFQQAKKEYLRTAKVPPRFEQGDLDRGFVVTGLWSWSRHPNFAAEQAIWFTLYQWSCVVTGTLYNWTIVGALSYVILFQASTWFTELISSEKYPEYAEYQQQVGMFLPTISLRFSRSSNNQKRENTAKATVDTTKKPAKRRSS